MGRYTNMRVFSSEYLICKYMCMYMEMHVYNMYVYFETTHVSVGLLHSLVNQTIYFRMTHENLITRMQI